MGTMAYFVVLIEFVKLYTKSAKKNVNQSLNLIAFDRSTSDIATVQ